MQLSQISLAITRLGQAPDPNAAIKALFAASEVGAWYDPSDLTTLFQDRAGSIPVTADGQAVGLILDKSKGLVLGPELAINGTFDTDTGWTKQAGWTISGGAATFTPGTSGFIYQTPPVVAGKILKITVSVTQGDLVFLDSQFYGQVNCGVGTTTLYIASRFNQINLWANTLTTFDNISIKEVAGNHATAPTDAARPLYKTDGTYHWLQFDGVDDSLSTAVFPITEVSGDAFIGVKHTDGTVWADVWISQQSSGGYWAIGSSSQGSISPTGASCGSPVYRRNGIDMVSPDRVDIYTTHINQTVVQTTKGLVFGAASPVSGISISGYPGAQLGGNIYSLIVRGAISTAAEITATESWVNGKTGAF